MTGTSNNNKYMENSVVIVDFFYGIKTAPRV